MADNREYADFVLMTDQGLFLMTLDLNIINPDGLIAHFDDVRDAIHPEACQQTAKMMIEALTEVLTDKIHDSLNS